MFCISTWCSLKQAEANSLRLFSKLGGNFLGYLHVDSKLPTFRRIKDLQVQASKLMTHHTRLPRDILFWKEQEELLPQGFAYMENLWLHEEDRIEELLEEAKKGGLSMMYNEDDSWAAHRINRGYYCYKRVPHGIHVDVNDGGGDKLPNELVYLENHGITTWSFEAPYFEDDQSIENAMVPLLKFLQGAQRCKEVCFSYTDSKKKRTHLSYTDDALIKLLAKVQKTQL